MSKTKAQSPSWTTILTRVTYGPRPIFRFANEAAQSEAWANMTVMLKSRRCMAVRWLPPKNFRLCSPLKGKLKLFGIAEVAFVVKGTLPDNRPKGYRSWGELCDDWDNKEKGLFILAM